MLCQTCGWGKDCKGKEPMNMKETGPLCTAIVLAGGSGSRMGSRVKKQFLELEGHPLLYYSMKCFQESPLIDRIVLVASPESVEYCRTQIVGAYGFTKTSAVVAGGAERYDSVYAGLCACEGDNPETDLVFGIEGTEITKLSFENSKSEYRTPFREELVFVHDSARPFVTEEILQRCFAAARDTGACSAGMPSKDTVNLTDSEGIVQTVPDRKNVWIVQTPQVFRKEILKEAHEKIRRLDMKGITDDIMVVRKAMGIPVQMVPGDYRNIKITTPEDLPLAESILKTF